MAYRLRDEVIAHFPATGAVASAQLWTSDSGRHAVVLTHNGAELGRRTGLGDERAEAEMAAARAKLAAAVVTEEVARAVLAAAGITSDWCQRDACGALLPLGAPWCARCGASVRRVAAGAVSAATRRPAIVVRGHGTLTTSP